MRKIAIEARQVTYFDMAGNGPPTGLKTVTITDNGILATFTVGGGDFSSLTANAQSLETNFEQTTGTRRPTSSSTTAASATQTDSTPTSSTPVSSTTSPTSQTTAAAVPESTSSGVSSASNGENPSTADTSCNSLSCKPGLQAAIAVPVVVGSLLIIALAFFCLRRRKRRQSTPASISEKRQRLPKKWSRHLRIFSFDAELLMGGRFSSSNSLRSRETGSQRSGARSAHNATPSIHSVDEEVAPPYRDAVTHTQAPSTIPMAAGLASLSTRDPFPRPDSVATAPPPYPAASGAAGAGAAGNISRATSRASTTARTPVSTRSLNDPFRNDALSPISPVDNHNDASPFIDPPNNARSPVSPSQSLRRPNQLDDDAQSMVSSVAEVASVREAQVGRTLSTKQGRRV